MNQRLQAIKQMVTPGISLIDIGSDHLILPNLLIDEGRLDKVYATDIKDGPLRTMEANRADRNIELFKSDGLLEVDVPVQSAVIAGMGGHLIETILLQSHEKFQAMRYLILQPMQHVEHLRYFLMHHYTIIEEALVLEDKYYHILKAVPGADRSYDVLLTKKLQDPSMLLLYLHEKLRQETALYDKIPNRKRLYHYDRILRLQDELMVK